MHTFASDVTDFSFLFGGKYSMDGEILRNLNLPEFTNDDALGSDLNQLLQGFLIAISVHGSFSNFVRSKYFEI